MELIFKILLVIWLYVKIMVESSTIS